MEQQGEKALVSTRTMEIAVGVLIFAIGALVIFDSNRLGFGWGDDGPQSGYFPFYIGLILCLSSAATIGKALKEHDWAGFVETGQARLVLAVLIPSTVYAIAVGLIGIYVASTVFIAAFMVWQGKFSILKSGLVGASVSIALFLMFEVWFTVPLPKGPLEALFGY